jgi:hypothetical protein
VGSRTTDELLRTGEAARVREYIKSFGWMRWMTATLSCSTLVRTRIPEAETAFRN